ncbi:MAG TPA: outer membrane beta-barrel protein, partial [Flavisolibacter sp.]|nr:outer membrane beta-barrel protein [Flavisolibacter sp.]
IWSLDAGVSATILKGKGSVKLSGSDLFRRMPWSGISRFGGLVIDAGGGWESRLLKLNFTYRFGNNEVKAARQRKTGLEDFNNRVQ